MKVSLDLDDWSVRNNYMDLLLALKQTYPHFKVSLFAVPDDIKHRHGEKVLPKDWMQIIPHGLHHNSAEAKKWTYDQFRNEIIPAIKKAFDADGIEFVRGFKAPHWGWNKEVVRALDDEGWWGAVHPGLKMILPKKYYAFTYSIDDFPLEETLKLHGHLNGTSKDDLEKCLPNLLRLPLDTEWRFITDFI